MDRFGELFSDAVLWAIEDERLSLAKRFLIIGTVLVLTGALVWNALRTS